MLHLINREQAGLLLAERLLEVNLHEPIVIALPRGGVPVAEKIARTLGAPLEVLIVRKVGAPRHEEFGIGAVTEEGYEWVDPSALRALGPSAAPRVHEIVAKEKREVFRRALRYRGERSLPDLHGRSVIVVDDGIATGVTARVACAYLRQRGAAQIVLAAPVCSAFTAALLSRQVDQLVCLDEPERFASVSDFYEEFDPVSDEEVTAILERTRRPERGQDAVA